MKKLHLVSLGCPKNLVDSEVMLGKLHHDGYLVVDDPAEADLLLINTCGFIKSAVEEAVDEILSLATYKQEDPAKKLVVTGCLVQRYGKDLRDSLPEVDLFVGTDGFQEIDTLVRGLVPGRTGVLELRDPRFIMDSAITRQLSTPFFRSYLKITEGCDNRCSYCMIPSIRGPLRSRPIVDLIRETQALQQAGVKELTLIAQDLTAYGNDLVSKDDLLTLVRQLCSSTDIPWIRLLYLYPSSISDQLLAFMAEQPRIVPYLDIPFQHFSDGVLRRMGRRYTGRDVDNLVERIRSILPDCRIRTSLMVGFPGETDADVEEVMSSLKRYRLDHVGVFQYEDEEGAPAFSLEDKVEPDVKKERYDRVMELQASISAGKLAGCVGMVEPVLVEGLSQQSELLLEGRTRFQAPDIDGCVYITDGQASPGDIVRVRISESHTYDLVGEIVDNDQ